MTLGYICLLIYIISTTYMVLTFEKYFTEKNMSLFQSLIDDEEFKKMDVKTMRKVILTFCFIPIINTILTIHYIKHGVF